jgi:hypothetical protein
MAELQEALEEVYDDALERAALEAFGGQYTPGELATRIERQAILQQALTLLQGAQGS